MSETRKTDLIYANPLFETPTLERPNPEIDVEPAVFVGRPCLRLEGGPVLLDIPEIPGTGATGIKVDVAADEPCTPGIAFRIQDAQNYERVYCRIPSLGHHNAIQYDPVFNGSNTWQIYHGKAFQKEAQLQTNKWHTFFVEFHHNRAITGMLGQEPLAVQNLARHATAGSIGLWSNSPCYFANLEVYNVLGPNNEIDDKSQVNTQLGPETITRWMAQDYGMVTCEPHGILNLNRYFPLSQKEVVLKREFELGKRSTVSINFGLSDDATLLIDGLALYTTTKPYRPTAGLSGMGYIMPDTCFMTRELGPGVHSLEVKLRVTEPFGWGLMLSIAGDTLKLLPT